MARVIIGGNITSGNTMAPGQLLVIGGFIMHADLAGHLDRIDTPAPEPQVAICSPEHVTNAQRDAALTESPDPSIVQGSSKALTPGPSLARPPD